MTARVPIIRSAGLLIYLVAMAATGLLTVMLSSVLATQGIALAQPYFVDNSSCKPSRIEQRRIAVQAAASPLADRMKSKVTALVAPSIPYDVLAAPCRESRGDGTAKEHDLNAHFLLGLFNSHRAEAPSTV